ncbi:MAG: peptidylprolyl isomerase [Sphingomonas sp. SCN 67-18]|nr:MAG: peptidylprolyl isomerase [Sphingomonas sp. SCN 67-18]
MRLFLALIAALAAMVTAAPTLAQSAGIVRVRIVTSEGPIVVALDTRRAPKTSANFLAYVDDERFDGTSFYRAARRKTDPRYGFIQGGISTDARRILPPFSHEPTTRTGISHLDATISMARRSEADSAGGNFFLTVGATPNMDARGDYEGYAAFGRVVSGMATVRRILALPTAGGSGAMKGQMIRRPVSIITARRLDGTPKPTGRPKPWLLGIRR